MNITNEMIECAEAAFEAIDGAGHSLAIQAALTAALQSAADTPSPVVPRCGVVGWPPLKKAIWDQVIAANLNSGKYISAWELTDSLYAAALAATATEDPLSPFKAKEE